MKHLVAPSAKFGKLASNLAARMSERRSGVPLLRAALFDIVFGPNLSLINCYVRSNGARQTLSSNASIVKFMFRFWYSRASETKKYSNARSEGVRLWGGRVAYRGVDERVVHRPERLGPAHYAKADGCQKWKRKSEYISSLQTSFREVSPPTSAINTPFWSACRILQVLIEFENVLSLP